MRYDLVQLPSNDPIEDDHSEKIVEIPSKETGSSDWMFWGVFDGHSYVWPRPFRTSQRDTNASCFAGDGQPQLSFGRPDQLCSAGAERDIQGRRDFDPFGRRDRDGDQDGIHAT